MDGYEATQKIRDFEEINNLERCYIVGLSGDSSSVHEKKCLQVKMNESLQKPISKKAIE